MKKIITILCVAFISISCSTPQSIAEKALDLVGSGTFYGQFNSEHIFIFSKYEDIFNNCIVKNSEAEYIRENGDISNTIKDENHFKLNILFNTHELISCDKSNISLYDYYDCSPQREYENMNKYGTGEVKYTIEEATALCKTIKDTILSSYSDCVEINEYLTFLKHKDIPFFHLRYKIDNTFIAHIYVVRIPKEGYRVCGLFFE